jgi:hypothetical protein
LALAATALATLGLGLFPAPLLHLVQRSAPNTPQATITSVNPDGDANDSGDQ